MHRNVLVLGLLLLGACDEICIDGECFAPEPDADLDVAVWLDWTTIPSPYGPTWFTSTWHDRSPYGHTVSSSDHSVPIQAIGDTNVLHFHVNHVMSVVPEEGDPLYTLEEGDYLFLMATSLDCYPGEPWAGLHELFTKYRPGGTSEDGPSGFHAFAYEPEPDGDRAFLTRVHACKPYFEGCSTYSNYEDTPITCDGDFQLVGMRRFTANGQSQHEGRIDGVSLGSIAAPAPNEGGATLTIAREGSPLRGRVAALVGIKGNVDDTQTCQLEQFLLDRMVDAGLRESAPNLGCPPP